VVAGRLAGLAAARDAGALTAEGANAAAAPLLREAGSLATFSDAVAGLMSPPARLVGAIAADTVVCRCEDVTRAELEAAIDAGATEVNQLKHFTRCGMGPCQGRMCGDVVAELLACRTGATRESVGQWTARPPLRPVPLADLMGRFDYADIPIPRPAPL
jgi:NAD(P)H-nitrite reductase large subunit